MCIPFDLDKVLLADIVQKFLNTEKNNIILTFCFQGKIYQSYKELFSTNTQTICRKITLFS